MKFFCDTINSDKIEIVGEDAKHLAKSLRVKIGEKVVVCDTRGYDYICTVSAINSDNLILDIISKEKSTAELSYELCLYQCLLKGEKWDFVLQKSVELGVTKIVPVISQNCVVRFSAKEFEKKRERYEKIILAAAKQSGRGIIPELSELKTINQAFDELKTVDLSIFCYENATKSLSDCIKNSKNTTSVGVLIGAEGGFTESEVDYAHSLGLISYSLGGRILRAETASLAVLSAVSIYLN